MQDNEQDLEQVHVVVGVQHEGITSLDFMCMLGLCSRAGCPQKLFASFSIVYPRPFILRLCILNRKLQAGRGEDTCHQNLVLES